ncbi:MAG: hypothetical protein ACQEXV_23695 [Bacillota bacterium]
MSVKDITDKQLNRAMAELMGYEVKKLGVYYMLVDNKGAELTGYRADDTDIWDVAPNYCNDAAASLEVQAEAIEADEELYIKNLADSTEANVHWDGYEGNMSPTGVAWMVSASPRERAEAAYMTLSSQD